MGQKTKKSNSPTVTTIEKGVKVRGNIYSEGKIFIVKGEIDGDLNVKNKMVIEKNGIVKGKATCNSCRLDGKFEGDLNVYDEVLISSSGKFMGNIILKERKLCVEKGAVFNCKCYFINNTEQFIKRNLENENLQEI